MHPFANPGWGAVRLLAFTENGVHMFLWLGLSLSPEFTQSVFGAQCTQQVDTDRTGLPVFDNPLSKRIRGIVDKIQEQKRRCMRVSVCTKASHLRGFFYIILFGFFS